MISQGLAFIPSISTTPAAQRPNPHTLDPDAPDHPAQPQFLDTEKFLENLTDKQHDALFEKFSKINDRIFRSDPPGPDVARQPGSWSFDVIGDYGSGRPAFTDVVGNIRSSDSSMVLTTGDNVYYYGTESDFQKKWDPTMKPLLREKPVLPTIGNHDIRSGTADPFFSRFPHLNNARYYSFERDGVHFVALDSNESLDVGTQQYEWLQAELSSAADAKFRVVYMHHPVWSSFPSKKNKANLAPIMAKHGVDLLLTGHEHWYSRSKPLNDYGTVQVVTGSGGESLVPFWYPQERWNANRQVRWGHMNFEVTNNALVGRFILRDGTVGDTFTIPQGGAAAAAGAKNIHQGQTMAASHS